MNVIFSAKFQSQFESLPFDRDHVLMCVKHCKFLQNIPPMSWCTNKYVKCETLKKLPGYKYSYTLRLPAKIKLDLYTWILFRINKNIRIKKNLVSRRPLACVWPGAAAASSPYYGSGFHRKVIPIAWIKDHLESNLGHLKNSASRHQSECRMTHKGSQQ